jgi:HSP20 family protein
MRAVETGTVPRDDLELVQQRTQPASGMLPMVADVQRIHADLNALAEAWANLASLGSDYLPAADVEETDDAFIVEIELPGVRKRDIEVAFSGGRLIVTGERFERERTGILRRRARRVGRFRFEIALPGREVVLPAAIEEDAVRATLADGVLTIRIPKVHGDRQRRVELR